MYRLPILAAFMSILFCIAPPAHAAFITPESAYISGETGDTLLVKYVIDPGSTAIYTAKLAVQFPSILAKLESFEFSPGWIPLSQPGYDEIDNSSGILVKTAGYPKGISDVTEFGTAHFVVLGKNKSAAASITNDSFLLDGANNNALGTATLRARTIVTPALAPAREKKQTVSPETVETSPTKPPVPETLFDVSMSPVEDSAPLSPLFLGAIVAFLSALAYVVWHVRRKNTHDV